MAVITVNTTADSGSGTLREAIANAQAGDTIKFASSLANQTITLQSHIEISIGKDLTIDGTDAANLTLSGGNTNRIFLVRSASVNPTDISISNLNFTQGKATPYGADNLKQGGAILTEHQARLTLTNVKFNNNIADDGGGAIFSAFEGNLTVTDSRFEGNIATAGNNERAGGAIGFRGPNNFTIKNSEFIGNKGINGGAINSLNGKLTIENSKFIDNDTTAAFYDTGKTHPFLRGYGGAIYTDRASAKDSTVPGFINITNSIFQGNTGRGEGGAAYLYTDPKDTVTIDGSLFQNNEIQALTWDDGTVKSNGGAIVQMNNGLNQGFTIRNTTFANNTAINQGGAVWMMDAPTTITNSTFSGNQTTGSSNVSSGGALSLYGTTDIVNTTIANNHAGWVGGAIAGDVDAAVSVKNTIFYNNTADNGTNDWNIQQNTNRPLIDLGNNLQFPAKFTNKINDFNATPSITIADPLLDFLQVVGGAWVHPLKTGSPAIDAASGAPTSDQRGLTRQDGDENGSVLADIGAFEFQSGAVVTPVPEIEVLEGTTVILDGATTPWDFGSTPVGTTLTKAFVIKNLGTQDLNLSNLQLPTGFALIGSLPTTVIPGDQVSIQISLDTSVAGTASGELTFATNDADENPFNFAITGTVTASGDGGGTPNPECPCDTVSPPTLPTLEQLLTQLEPSRKPISGTLADDVLWGDVYDNSLVGEGGNDSIAGAEGNDVILGDDTLGTQTGADVIFGNTGSDTMFGGMGNDWVFGGKDADLIYGNLENDILYGDRGNDTLDGGEGDDIMIGGDPAFVETESDLMFGGLGSDSIFGNWGSDTSFGGDGDDWLFGGKDEDLLFGDAGDDRLSGDRGNDTLCGGAGNDFLVGGNGSLIPIGESLEQDFICGGAGNDVMLGNEGADRLNGDADNDTLNGGKDNDILDGGEGADLLAGNQGDDTLSGGAGADRFNFQITDGNNTITDFEDGVDTIGLQGVTFGELTIAQVGSDTQITAGSLAITLKGVSSSAIDATDVVLV